MQLFILIMVVSLAIVFASRVYDLEQRYKVIVKNYKELSHHVLITNRDGLRTQKDSNWERKDVSDNPDRIEGPLISCSTKEIHSEN